MPSIRRKIALGSYALVAIIALLALFAYSDLRYLEQRIDSGVAIYDFLDAVLEIRLEEKSFLQSADAKNLQSALAYAHEAASILQAHRSAFLVLQTEPELQGLETLLREYSVGLSLYRDLTWDGGHRIEQATDLVPRQGERLTVIAEALAAAERTELRVSVSRSKGALLASVIIVALLGVAAAHLLSRFSVRPLAWLETELAAIGEGRYNQLQPVSRDREIVSVSRAVNRMLDDIEVRNRRLLQTEKLASLGTLASGVAHELNNPLSNISTSCQILMEEIEQDAPTDPMEWLEQIDRETDRARLIVKSILEFSNENRVSKTEVRLHEVIGKSLLLMGQKGNSRIRIDAVPKDIRIHADGQKLQQVFINLFKNALDAGGTNVGIDVRARTVTGADVRLPRGMMPGKRYCTADCSNGALVIEVEDDGPGIPPGVLPRVFDPFFTTKDVGHGEGLGLYVSQEIIDLHGGCIGVSSEPGKGARYMICFPCEKRQEPSVPL